MDAKAKSAAAVNGAAKPAASVETLTQQVAAAALEPVDVRAAVAAGSLEQIAATLRNKKASAAAKDAALGELVALLPGSAKAMLPFALPLLPVVLDCYAERTKSTVELANKATNAIMRLPAPWAVFPVVFPILIDVANNSATKKEAKVAALKHLGALVKRGAGRQVAEHLERVIEGIEPSLHDIADEVSKTAIKTLTDLCAVITNADIVQHVEILVQTMARPNEVASCLDKISRTTFVATVDGPSLAIMVPLLLRALQERSATLLRPTVIIIDNLAKLVVDPAVGKKFLPLLEPGVLKIVETAAFPEVRALASSAHKSIRAVLDRVEGPGGVVDPRLANVFLPFASRDRIIGQVISMVEARLAKNGAQTEEGEQQTAAGVDDVIACSIETVIAPSLLELVNFQEFDQTEWTPCIAPFLAALLPAPQTGEESTSPAQPLAETIADEIFTWYDAEYQKIVGPRAESPVDPNEVPLCDIVFSLAYGTKLLLHNAHMRLVRGRRYGLLGRNGAGKSTLMTSINNGKVENFPGKEQGVRTIMVEHTIQGEDGDKNIIDFVMDSFTADDAPSGEPDAFSREKVTAALREVGFDDDRLSLHVGGLSGGWKMKLALARAILYKADLLLLDEPTNHLDVANVKWLQDFLLAQTNVTALIVSHDTGFLDTVLTDVLHYEKNKKLKHYRGNLAEFVRVRPEAKTYYTLSTSALKFTFPRAGILTGIKSQTKAILSMTDCTYTYPGRDKPSLLNASCKVSMSSRVAIIGPNGAGKSTLIKILTGEAVPQTGSVSKHPNLRLAYVAQHAFHHLDQHLELTPNKYIQWRYQFGEDREVTEKESRKISKEEKEQMEVRIEVRPGEFRKVESLVGRQKLNKSYQYEVKWLGMEHRDNTWVPRERLIDRGFSKLVQAFDDREASREGLVYREMNPSHIRQHFEDIGLEGDIADRELSGFLAASWSCSNDFYSRC